MTVSVRDRVVAAASYLLEQGGLDAVTTREVAARAGVQPPAIYRLFGDKDGLLAAVAEHGVAAFLAGKPAPGADDDPVDALRAGMDHYVDAALAHPALHALLRTLERGPAFDALQTGADVLVGLVHAVAVAGRLRVPEATAVALVRAAGQGTVDVLLATPVAARDPLLRPTAREAVVAAVTTDRPGKNKLSGAARAAVTLRARLDDDLPLSAGERLLLVELLDRLAGG